MIITIITITMIIIIIIFIIMIIIVIIIINVAIIIIVAITVINIIILNYSYIPWKVSTQENKQNIKYHHYQISELSEYPYVVYLIEI